MIRSSAYLISSFWCSREVPARRINISARTKSARADVPNRSDGIFIFSGFLCFAALDLILALVFPTFMISKYNFLSGALPLETPPGALPLGTPRAVSAARPHFLIVAPYSQFGPQAPFM